MLKSLHTCNPGSCYPLTIRVHEGKYGICRLDCDEISTYDTDYVLVKNNDIDNAAKALANEGYRIEKEGKHICS